MHVRAPTGPCWQGGRRQHGLARARLHFESGLWPLHPSAPMYAAEGSEGEGEGKVGRSGWQRLGRGTLVAAERQPAKAESAGLRTGEAQAVLPPCDRLGRAEASAGRLRVRNEERGAASRPGRLQLGEDARWFRGHNAARDRQVQVVVKRLET